MDAHTGRKRRLKACTINRDSGISGTGCSRFMQVPQRGHVVASIMHRELRLLLVPSRLPWVEGARKGPPKLSACLFEEIFQGCDTVFGLQIAEMCFENAFCHVGSAATS